jgi:AcrR family transcriptional regulator
VPERTATQLPKGRHGLSREEVEASQRLRILAGMAEAMQENGYVDTSVADVIRRAGVSRETFYRLFSSKADCFAAAFDVAAEVLLERVGTAVADGGQDDGIVAFGRALSAYLDTLADEAAWARLFIVEVHAAGPDALARRFALQDRIVDAVADLLADRYTAQLVVSALSSMVTRPLVEDDPDGIRALGPPLLAHLHGYERAKPS